MQKLYTLLYAIVLSSCVNKMTPESGTVKAEATDAPAKMQEAQTMPSDSLPTSELTKIYAQAIADYIKAVRKDYSIAFDTLYFGKHVYGQPDDFPEIDLPETIEHTHIRLVTPEFGAQKQQEKKSSFFINLMGWADRENAEFIFVTFSNNNQHQFDYYLDYHYDMHSKAFVMDKIRFENFFYKKR